MHKSCSHQGMFMPLFEPERAQIVHQELSNRTFALLRKVALPRQHFAAGPGGAADILLKRLDDNSGCILLIEEGVRYLGHDQALLACFGSRLTQGWRPLTVLRPAEPDTVLMQADILLGLNGAEPRLPEPLLPRELVVGTEEVERERARHEASGNEVDRFGTDLVAEARRGHLAPALFREPETAAVIRVLSKEGKNAVCLVGEPGVGKTRVVEHLALLVAIGEVPGALRGVRILDVNLSMLAAGAVHQNEFEGRMKQVLDLARRDAKVILFLDEIHTLRAPGSDASQMVKSDLGRGRIRCIGATTPREFRLIESDAALARRFQVVPVGELTREQAVHILEQVVPRLEAHHHVEIPAELLPVVVDLSIRYVPSRHLPDKALDLLDEACACACLDSSRIASGVIHDHQGE
jgi:hypothetical protein